MQAYIDTDQHLHWLCQIIAKANRTYVPPVADDSHTNLYYDSLGQRLSGRWIDNGRQPIMLTYNLANSRLEWVNNALQPLVSFTTIGRPATDIENEIAENLPALNLYPVGFTEPLHFEITSYPFAGEPLKELSEEGLQAWTTFRQLANEVAAAMLGHLQVPGEVRIWPHHFDTGIYFEIPGKPGIGFGLAMADSLIAVPYFYLAGYAEKAPDYNTAPALGSGEWLVQENWQGAILPLDRINSLPAAGQHQQVAHYALQALNWYLA